MTKNVVKVDARSTWTVDAVEAVRREFKAQAAQVVGRTQTVQFQDFDSWHPTDAVGWRVRWGR